MKYLVEIFNTVEKINSLKQKMQNDPLDSNIHEREMWILYTKVTKLKDAYYDDRAALTPGIKNAYVTFRSMEGKARVLQAYSPNVVSRLFTEIVCCMPNVFKKKKLLQKGFYDVVEPGDPENIIWENLGITFFWKFFRYTAAFIVSLIFFVGSFYAIWWIANFEKSMRNYLKRECGSVDSSVSAEIAI